MQVLGTPHLQLYVAILQMAGAILAILPAQDWSLVQRRHCQASSPSRFLSQRVCILKLECLMTALQER